MTDDNELVMVGLRVNGQDIVGQRGEILVVFSFTQG